MPNRRLHTAARSAAPSLAAAALVLGAAACTPGYRTTGPVAPRTVAAADREPADAYQAALQAVAESGMRVVWEDPDAGVIRTDWEGTFFRYSPGSPPARRMRFTLTVAPGGVTVRPRVESCTPAGCTPERELRETEQELYGTLLAAVQTNLTSRPATARARGVGNGRDIGLQAGREADAAPGTVVIRTREGGWQEVSVGQRVDVHLVNGNRVRGTVEVVTPEALVVDLGTNNDLVLQVEGIARIVTAN